MTDVSLGQGLEEKTTKGIPAGKLYKKKCRVCENVKTFKAGTERDKQSICGNCWDW